MIEHRMVGSTIVVTIQLENMRDQELVNQIKDEMTRVATQSSAKNMVIDLHHVTYCGSVGLLVFLAMRRVSNLQTIVLCNLNTNVHELFHMCRLIPTGKDSSAPFKHSDTVSSALESLQV